MWALPLGCHWLQGGGPLSPGWQRWVRLVLGPLGSGPSASFPAKQPLSAVSHSALRGARPSHEGVWEPWQRRQRAGRELP